jgi:UDP-N-acetylglucosamine--N-acetylmuramyl-(pentapeptide) pyrophosphoryl-undecaprenol N-acetylglucosamine transferase
VRITITGGGSGGHTSAASAIIQFLQAHHPEIEMVWITSRDGIEVKTASTLGLPVYPIVTGKLDREISFKMVRDVLKVPFAILDAWRQLRRWKPDLILSTGGYVAVPVVIAGAALGIPSVIHDQTLAAGLANRISARFADRILLSFEESRRYFPPDKSKVTGCPVRPEIFKGERGRGLGRFGFSPAWPVVYITGGAQGAESINHTAGLALPALSARAQIILQCGTLPQQYGETWLRAQSEALPAASAARIVIETYFQEEIADIFAMADLVVGRAGAGTVNELRALGIPALLIPLPHAQKDEQTLSARMLAREGAAHVLPESELTPDRLVSGITDALREMPRESVPARGNDAASSIVEEVLSYF